jgi:DNA modification methylase
VTPYFADEHLTVYLGDCREAMAQMEPESVHCVVTSPPYWGLRDYGVVGQLGLETTPEEYVANMVAVFREVRRVLRPDGTVWLNLGDSYASSPAGNTTWNHGDIFDGRDMSGHHTARRSSTIVGTLKPKDLVGIPWRVAFALQADGWYLRSDIIWSKPNPMPESVTDRPTKSHEYLFLLSKSARYYYDGAAIAEEAADTSIARWRQNVDAQAGSERVPGKTNGTMRAVGGKYRPQARRAVELAEQAGLTEAHIAAIRSAGITDTGKALVTTQGRPSKETQRLADEARDALGGYYREFLIAETRNARTVWTIPTSPYKAKHFATFPRKLVEPCVKAGCPEGGTVLDPFAGSGTTALVAQQLGRRAVLIDLSADYLGQVMVRNAQKPLGLVGG